MPFLFSKRRQQKRHAQDEAERRKQLAIASKAYASSLEAPRLFNVSGRVVVKFTGMTDPGLALQTVGRVCRGDVTSAYAFESAVLGLGQVGQTRPAMNRYTGKIVAIKTFLKKRAKKDMINLVRNEAQVHLKVDHPNIVRLVEVWEDSAAVHLVMEFCPEGQLTLWSKNWHRRYTPEEWEVVVKHIARQMVRVVSYLHNHNIVHRDIKLSHFLIDGEYKLGGIEGIPLLKLIDFGFARTWNMETSRPMRATCGTLPYTAPEVLLGNYNSLCDVWSLGCSLYQLIFGYPLFSGSERKMAQDILYREIALPPNVDSILSAEGQDFLLKCLERKVSNRAHAFALFNHRWFGGPTRLNKMCISEKRLMVDLKKGLDQFPDLTFFNKAVQAFISFGLTTEETKEIADVFAYLDHTGKGAILPQHFRQFLISTYKFSAGKAERIEKSVSVFGRGEIGFSDFVAACLGSFIPLDDVIVRQTFWKFDRKRTGDVTVANMREVLGIIYSDKQLEQMLREADKDGDKTIDYDEFARILQNNNRAVLS